MSTEEGKKDPQNWREATAALWEVVQEALQRLEGVPTQEAFETLQEQVRQVEEHLAIEGDYFRGAIGGMEGRLQSAIKEGDEFAVLFETLQSDVNLLSENLVQIRGEFALLQEAALEWHQGARETQGQVSVVVNEVECIRSDINRIGDKARVRLDAQKMLVQDLQKRMDDRDAAGRQFRECLDALQGQVDQTQRDGAEGRADFDTLQAEVRKFAIETVDQKHVNTDTIDAMKTEIKSLQAFRERIDENMSDYIETATAAYGELSERVRVALENWPVTSVSATDDVSRVQAREIREVEEPLSMYWMKRAEKAEARIASLEAALKTANEEKDTLEDRLKKAQKSHYNLQQIYGAIKHTMARKEDEPAGGLAYTPDLDEYGRDTNDTDYPADAYLGALVRRMPELARQCGRRVALEYDEVGNIEAWQVKVPDRFLSCQSTAEEALHAALGDDNTETPDRDGGVTRPEELGLYSEAQEWTGTRKEEAP